ncbi:MAG: FAD-dependent oxidoreductase [Deltaproteobacteria bacterium]|nr:FAD-dependent oxidoreductase [Deltaproteobacteria bacterium]
MPNGDIQKFDSLVLGGGIAGLAAALDLADAGYRVAVVERDASIGGKMIRLSKVFPTLDCASCITTPKMAAAAHHPNVTLFTLCRLDHLDRRDGRLVAQVTQLPRYVDPVKCIGCRQCEYECPVMVPDPEQGGFTARKAIYIPFSNAIPQLALIDREHCLMCGKCSTICPTGAVDQLQKEESFVIEAGAVVLATGYELMTDYPARAYGAPGLGDNVITSLQMERLLAPHGPYMRALRPGDGKEPESIAFIQCAGSRDLQLGKPYCSRVCCMYAIKQAMLLSGALPLADLTVYYMDIRAFGKNYEQFYMNAKAMGVEFVKAKPIIAGNNPDGSVILRYEDQEGGGGAMTREHDLVVLSLAMLPAYDPQVAMPLTAATDGFMAVPQPKLAPCLTEMAGVFTCGAAAGPKDIVDSIAEAGAAALGATKYLAARKNGQAA